jgi:hypothetical protein
MIMTITSQDQRFYRRNEAAQYLQDTYRIRCSAKTLANYASIGKGPKFYHHGRFPIYSKDELDNWAISNLGVVKEPSAKSANNLEAGQ